MNKVVNDMLDGNGTAHNETVSELQRGHRELEAQVDERTRELTLLKARFETALRGANVYVYSQDRDLRYSWVYSPRGEAAAAELIGRTDSEILGSREHEAVIAAKRRVLATGVAEDCEVTFVAPGRKALFALHIDPTYGPDKSIDGIMCAAVDISRTRSLETEQQRLSDELASTLQRFETALRGSNVTVFTQDRDLRYTSVSNSMFGLAVEEILGRTDEDILPPDSRASVVTLKREVLEQGEPTDSEIRVDLGSTVRWYDVHIEPLHDPTGAIGGLTCAAVDITERKEGEAHLRLLMRELTHRSKNLLAVIQAMARQTAKHGGTVQTFVERFSERVQALARSHELLVGESWRSASLHDLVRSQLAYYIDREPDHIVIEGPELKLRPEAAQSLGL